MAAPIMAAAQVKGLSPPSSIDERAERCGSRWSLAAPERTTGRKTLQALDEAVAAVTSASVHQLEEECDENVLLKQLKLHSELQSNSRV
ncbi:uncharacterized protein V6R79_015257 [Siganus canaliculatus]